MSDRRFSVGLLREISVSISLALIFCILSPSETGGPGRITYFMIFLGLAAYLIVRLFLRKERSLRSAAFLNLGLWLAGMAAAAYMAAPEVRFRALILFGILSGILISTHADMAVTGVKLHSMTLYFDLSALVLLFFGIYITSAGISEWLFLLPALGMGAAMTGLILIRSGRRPGLREMALYAALLLGVTLGMLLFFHYAAAPSGELVLKLWSLLLGLLRGAAGLVMRLLAFILSLFPAGEEGALLPEMEPEAAGPDIGEASGIGLLAYILGGLLLAAVLGFVIVLILKALGSMKAGGKADPLSSGGKAVSRGKRSSLYSLLKARLRLLSWLRAHRGTAMGAYYGLVWKNRHSAIAKKPGETVRTYLTRLDRLYEETRTVADRADIVPPEAFSPMLSLAGAAEREMYGMGSALRSEPAGSVSGIGEGIGGISPPTDTALGGIIRAAEHRGAYLRRKVRKHSHKTEDQHDK